MDYEIIGETIKSATSIKIGDIFKVATNQTDNQGNVIYTYPKRYKENVTSPTYPSFWIIEVNKSITPAGPSGQLAIERKSDRIQIDYLINVQYRVAANTETVTNLRQQLDAVGLKLCSELTELNLGKVVQTKNRNYEIIDGVGQFTFNVTVFATTKEEQLQFMRNFILDENIKEED